MVTLLYTEFLDCIILNGRFWIEQSGWKWEHVIFRADSISLPHIYETTMRYRSDRNRIICETSNGRFLTTDFCMIENHVSIQTLHLRIPGQRPPAEVSWQSSSKKPPNPSINRSTNKQQPEHLSNQIHHHQHHHHITPTHPHHINDSISKPQNKSPARTTLLNGMACIILLHVDFSQEVFLLKKVRLEVFVLREVAINGKGRNGKEWWDLRLLFEIGSEWVWFDLGWLSWRKKEGVRGGNAPLWSYLSNVRFREGMFGMNGW